MNLFINLFKIKKASRRKQTGLKSPLLSLGSSLLYFTGVIKFFKGRGNFTIKFYSSRLNIRPYNKLSKEIGDFKDSEDECIYI